MIVTDGFRRHHLPAPHIVHAIQNGGGTGITGFLHGLNPARVEIPAAEFLVDKGLQTLHLEVIAAAQVGHKHLRRLAVQMTHRQTQATKILEGVIIGHQRIQVGRTGENHTFGAGQRLTVQLHLTDGFTPAFGIFAKRIAHAAQVVCRHVGIAVPTARVQRGTGQTGTIVAALVGKNSYRGQIVSFFFGLAFIQ